MRTILLTAILFVFSLSFGTAEAVQTKLVVRAKSKDAKFVGTSMGGAHVLVKDSKSGKILAKGLTEGATGNTTKIMINPKTRYSRITDANTARFETSIDIDEPALVTIEVEAPYGLRPNTIKSSTQVWVIPGKDLTGEGVTIEVPGFSVTSSAPQAVKLSNNKADIPVQARIVMI